MLKPGILVRDPDLIKDMVTTNFNSFRNNDVVISQRFDPLTATNPFFLEDDEWREARKTISPMFSQIKVNPNRVLSKVVTKIFNLFLAKKCFASNE